MFLVNRKMFAAVGATAAAVATTALFAAPAQAITTTATAKVLGLHNSIVSFTAAAGQQNSLVVTISGNTVTLNDKVAIKAGKGCKAVKGDRTKVRCTTARKPTEISVSLGDRNDKVTNKTAAPLLAEGGPGNDTLRGGSTRDRLFGGTGNDKLYGGAATDALDGEAGDDYVFGGSGNDWLSGGDGHDLVFGESGNDAIYGYGGDDALNGGQGNDNIHGGAGNDTLTGGAGKDKLVGGPGKDRVYQ
jgi:Ca2+-binding RTX toxin-like protein